MKQLFCYKDNDQKEYYVFANTRLEAQEAFYTQFYIDLEDLKDGRIYHAKFPLFVIAEYNENHSSSYTIKQVQSNVELDMLFALYDNLYTISILKKDVDETKALNICGPCIYTERDESIQLYKFILKMDNVEKPKIVSAVSKNRNELRRKYDQYARRYNHVILENQSQFDYPLEYMIDKQFKNENRTHAEYIKLEKGIQNIGECLYDMLKDVDTNTDEYILDFYAIDVIYYAGIYDYRKTAQKLIILD